MRFETIDGAGKRVEAELAPEAVDGNLPRYNRAQGKDGRLAPHIFGEGQPVDVRDEQLDGWRALQPHYVWSLSRGCGFELIHPAETPWLSWIPVRNDRQDELVEPPELALNGGSIIAQLLDLILPQPDPPDAQPYQNFICLVPAHKADVVGDDLMPPNLQCRGKRRFPGA